MLQSSSAECRGEGDLTTAADGCFPVVLPAQLSYEKVVKKALEKAEAEAKA